MAQKVQQYTETAHTSAVPSTTALVCASFFFKMAAAIRCCPMPKCYQN